METAQKTTDSERFLKLFFEARQTQHNDVETNIWPTHSCS